MVPDLHGKLEESCYEETGGTTLRVAETCRDSDETRSTSSMMKSSQGLRCMTGVKSLKEGRTEVENMRRKHLLQGKLWSTYFKAIKRLTHRFSHKTTNHQGSVLFKAF
jgi:hypothetical protein